jgi:hypothetical protein
MESCNAMQFDTFFPLPLAVVTHMSHMALVLVIDTQTGEVKIIL